MEQELRPFWGRIFTYSWKFGLVLILAVCVPRFIMVLHANATGSYSSIAVIMVISALVPYLFLARHGRKRMGIARPKKFHRLLVALATGIVLSVALYALGRGLFGDSPGNWYLYIGRSYRIPEGMGSRDKLIMFAITAAMGMIFSPIGEELFFRGIVHSSFARSIGERKASLVDSSAFAATHVAHFGLVFLNGRWEFLALPALIWVACMLGISMLFFAFKKFTGSILGAILCHAGFNLGMIYCIFYLP